jgi:hypothetical protein
MSVICIGLDRRARRKRDNARAPMTIAARAPHVAQGDADRGLVIPRFHTQIQINHGPATVARDDQPGMLRGNRRCDLRPKPNIAFRGKPCGEQWPGRRARLPMHGVFA